MNKKVIGIGAFASSLNLMIWFWFS